jgi:hypothetical protein
MRNTIETEYDRELDAITVRMPESIMCNALTTWQSHFLALLGERERDHGHALLFDSHTHNFESFECLRLLRELFDELVATHCLSRIAFVAPRQFREPEIRSPQEAYFETFDEASKWLASF